MKLVFLTLLMLLNGLQALARNISSEEQNQLQTPPSILQLALNWKPEPQFGGFYQALIDGEFKKRNLDVKILEGGSGTPTIQMLVFKKVDVAIVSAEEIVISNERNPKNPVVALFAVYQTNPQVLITRKQRKIENLAELMSKPGIISAQAGLTYVSFLKRKYPKSSVRWVPYIGGISGLIKEENYAQQGFLTSEPLLAEKQNIEVSTFLVADEGFNPYTTVVAVRKQDFELYKKRYVTLIAAIESGWQNYLKDPTKANRHMAQMNRSLDYQTFEKSAQAQRVLIQPLDFKDPLGSMSEDRWWKLIQTLKELKVIKKSLKPKDQYANSLEKLTP